MKKKILSICLVLTILSMMSVTAYAADGDAADAPKGTQGNDITASTGAASITSEDGVTFNTENDDDSIEKAADTNGADINVWAKVIDASSPVYKIDINWGEMKFEYSSGEGTWDPETHSYTGASTGGWTQSYLEENDGNSNNKIEVVNHSNNAIKVEFSFAMEQNAFNNDSNATDAVRGHFFPDATTAITASGENDDSANVTGAITGIELHTADKYYATEQAKTDDTPEAVGARTGQVYFAFSGKPDSGKGVTLNTFKKVGVITVTVAPHDNVGEFEF